LIRNPPRDGGSLFYVAYYGHDDHRLYEVLEALYARSTPGLTSVAPHCVNGYNADEHTSIGWNEEEVATMDKPSRFSKLGSTFESYRHPRIRFGNGMSRLGLTPMVLVLATFLFTERGEAETLPSRAALLAHFSNVVFLTDEVPRHQAKPLVRWAGPISARLVGEKSGVFREQVETLFRQLSKLTGLPFRLVGPNAPINMAIQFMPTTEIRSRLKLPNVNCAGILHGDKSRSIVTGAIIYVSTDNDFRTRHCIVEEITQTLGLTNDSKTSLDTIFNDESMRTSLSLADQILIRTLYDRRLKLGMKAAEAAPVAEKVIGEMLDRLRKGMRNKRPIRVFRVPSD